MAAATVLLQGSTTVYAQTDDLGNYQIKVPSNGVLVFSFLGYETVEMPVNGRAVIDVALKFEAEALGDVVVVAYGTVRKEASTGAVSMVTGDVISESPVTSVDKMLSGKIPGVHITTDSGQPGANSQIRIRGISSINAGNEPLWVIDGIPVMSGNTTQLTNTGNTIASFNPNDIESITVLKDAAASSLYGSRAANGVILVTTKGGKAGKAKFTARVKFGGSTLANDNHFGVMNAHELLDFQRTAAINAGYNPDDPTSSYYRPLSILTRPMTNWMKEFTRMGMLQEYEINAQAGTEKGRFYSSLAYQKNNGITYHTDMEKITARVNSDYQLSKTLQIGTRVNLAYTKQNDTPMQNLFYSNPFWAGLSILPWTPFLDADGEYNVNIPENSNANPLFTAKHDDQWEKQFHLNGIVYLQWEPVKGLVLKTNNSAEGIFSEGRRYWYPVELTATTGTLQTTNDQFLDLNTSNTISYSNIWGDHSFSVLAGQEAMRHTWNDYYVYAKVDRKIPYLNTSTPPDVESSYGYVAETLLSFFGKVDYDYGKRYFVNASIRGDGSSLFGEDHHWGLFWSVAAAWNMANEKWMQNVAWLNLLKIRASYGVTGNNSIGAYGSYGKYAATAYNGLTGFVPGSPANNNLSWEKSNELNVGLDFGFFENRLSGSIDFYQKKTTDMLLNKRIPQTTGFSSNIMNIGSLKNTGIEILLEGDIIRTNDWYWNVGANLSWNKSKILNLGDVDEMTYAGDSRIKHKVGKQFYTYYLKDYYGVNPSNGEALWYAEDGKLTSNYNKARYVYSGSPEPLIFGGFNTTLSWKGLNLSAFFEYKYGNKVFIVDYRYTSADGEQMSTNQLKSAKNYWKRPGDTGVNPRPVAANGSRSYHWHDRWLQDGSYIRIKDITLSYSLQKKALDKIKLQGLKFYVSGLNLYTLHDVNHWDPERGIDGFGYGIYPVTKTIIGGIEITF